MVQVTFHQVHVLNEESLEPVEHRAPYSHHHSMASTPWFSNFPTPISKPRSVTAEYVASLIKDPKKKRREPISLLWMSVARILTSFPTEHFSNAQIHMVRTAVNIPAQSFYP